MRLFYTFLVVLLFSLPVRAVSPPAVPEKLPDVLQTAKPFNHHIEQHKKIECQNCHNRVDNNPKPDLPGHAACIDCHVNDFTSTASQLCADCHSTPLKEKVTAFPFPDKLREFGLKGFSHKDHTDPEKMKKEKQLPSCMSCHGVQSDGLRVDIPYHPECYSCHTHQAGQKLGPCQACHIDAQLSLIPATGMNTYERYRFQHASHMKEPSIQSMCQTCHPVIPAVANTAAPDIVRISTARGQTHSSGCWVSGCHDVKRELRCKKCHISSPAAIQ